MDWLQKSPLPPWEGAFERMPPCLFSRCLSGFFSCFLGSVFSNFSGFFSYVGSCFSFLCGFFSDFLGNFSGLCGDFSFCRRLTCKGKTSDESCCSSACDKFLHKSFPS